MSELFIFPLCFTRKQSRCSIYKVMLKGKTGSGEVLQILSVRQDLLDGCGFRLDRSRPAGFISGWRGLPVWSQLLPVQRVQTLSSGTRNRLEAWTRTAPQRHPGNESDRKQNSSFPWFPKPNPIPRCWSSIITFGVPQGSSLGTLHFSLV